MISVNWITGIISIPRADMLLIQSNPVEIRQLNTNELRLDLRDLEDDIDGRPWPRTHDHNADVLVGGISLADVLILLDPYTITFEDGQYAVYLQGTNNNILEKTNKNQVSVNPNNSAGLVNSQSIEAAEFGREVTIDVGNITGHAKAGTLAPTGTFRQPSNNIPDSVLIAAYRGFNTFFIVGNLTLGSGHVVSGFSVVGQNPTLTALVIEDAAVTNNCEIKECLASGILDGNTKIECCIVDDLSYVSGCIYNSVLKGEIVLGGSQPAMIIDCRCYPQTEVAEIDMGGSGQDLGIRNFNGRIKIKNLTGDNIASLDMNSGKIILDYTCTAGTIVCRGIAKLTDNSNGATVINELLSVPSIWGALRTGHILLGSMGEAINILWSQAGGRRVLDEAASQEIFYKADNITEVMRFNLFDKDGNPATKNVFERVRV